MTEEVPAALAADLQPAKAPAKKAKKAAVKARKPPGPSVTELLTQAVSASKERSGVSLAALKKSLAAAGYDVEKNNSRIKLGLKSLVTKGTLVQTKGTGASGSFKLNKKQAAETKDKVAKKKPQGASGAAKSKKPAAKKPASAAKKVRKVAAAAKGAPRVKVTKPKKAARSPAKSFKPQAKAKPKASKAKRPAKKK
ncbi:PREDICTED: histone H1-like [Gekko japonicus]|uniref:Histone H1-like n=1 Tax=Gekko japonicus TaxID=146911 RepID=A0ABM1KS20_GEKJA|nr:PREDICTED: histone H1-like [Gekko japonicus]